MTEGAQWAGQPIKLETEFIINERMVQSLALAGATPRRRGPCPGLSHRPRRLFGLQRGLDAALCEYRRRRSTSFPASSTGLRPMTARSRSTSWRLKPGGAARKRTSMPALRPRSPSAAGGQGRRSVVHVGPDGVRRQRAWCPRPPPTPRQPYFSSSSEAQAEFIIGNIAKLCDAAGTSLAMSCASCNFTPTSPSSIRSTRSGSAGLTAARCRSRAVEVPAPLPVPGATVLIEAWAYAP